MKNLVSIFLFVVSCVLDANHKCIVFLVMRFFYSYEPTLWPSVKFGLILSWRIMRNHIKYRLGGLIFQIFVFIIVFSIIHLFIITVQNIAVFFM